MSSVGEKYDSSLGVLQLPRMDIRTHSKLKSAVISLIGKTLEVVYIPTMVKPDYGDVDIYVNNPVETVKEIVTILFGIPENVNDRCITTKLEGHQVDVISIHEWPTVELFYGNNVGLLMHFILNDTQFSLGTAGFLLQKPLGGKFCLSVNNYKILEFLGISRRIIQDDLQPQELFELLTASPFYDPTRVVVDKARLMARYVVNEFVSFVQKTPKSSGPIPTVQDALAFFGKSEEFATLIAQEQRSKDAEARQANVKKQLSAAINTAGFKGKDVKVQFDVFKAWIHQTKGMTYEDWAQTEPNVEEAFEEYRK